MHHMIRRAVNTYRQIQQYSDEHTLVNTFANNMPAYIAG